MYRGESWKFNNGIIKINTAITSYFEINKVSKHPSFWDLYDLIFKQGYITQNPDAKMDLTDLPT